MSNYMTTFKAENRLIFEKHIHKLANSIFSAIADQSSQVQRQLWSIVLFNFSHNFEDKIWSVIDIKKGLLPQLHTCLKNSGFGAHAQLYQNFVSFISILPIFVLHKPLETAYKVESNNPTKKTEEKEEIKDNQEQEGQEKPNKSKNKKKGKNKGNKGNEGGGEKVIKNSFSVSEKINIMFEIMKSHFSGINLEVAVAFSDDIVNSYYDSMSFLYLKRVIPSIQALSESKDDKSLAILNKKITQCFMLPISEYLKKNDPSLNRSIYSSIPKRASEAIVFFAEKGIEIDYLSPLFDDIKETMMIGLERSPQNTIKVLSTILMTVKSDCIYYDKIQQICGDLINNLYDILIKGVNDLNKDTIESFEKNIEIFSYIAHNLLTSGLSSPIFDINEAEKSNEIMNPYEFQILTKVLKMVKMVSKKLKQEFLRILEIIEEKLWLCLVLRMNYLLMRGYEEVKQFMDGPMLDLIFEDIKKFDIGDDRYLHFVIQYISPADCLALLVSENIERSNLKKFKKQVLDKRNKELEQVFIPYEKYMKESSKVQDQCLKNLFIDMIDDYSKSHQIATIYSIFKRKVEDYVISMSESSHHTIITDDTMQSFLESTHEFLTETDQVHKSFQLSELSNVLSKFILTVEKSSPMFEISQEICKVVFKILLNMQQNLASALEIWKFMSSIINSDQYNHDGEFLDYIEEILRERVSSLIKLSNYQENEFNKEILVLKNYINIIPRQKVSPVDSLSRIIILQDNFRFLSKN